jgi:hypothetical protein
MTPKQIERLQKKITDIKRRLSAEKRKFGCYDDSRGLRYLPIKYFIQLTDYKGGLTYTKWFDKNFPDDMGFPDFLFGWTIILFKTGKTKEAEKKAFQTFCSNTYLFDKYFGRQVIAIDKWEGSNLEIPDFTEHFGYSREQKELGDFTKWLDTFISTEHFINRSTKYIDIQKLLKTERDEETRHYLVKAASELEQSL